MLAIQAKFDQSMAHDE